MLALSPLCLPSAQSKHSVASAPLYQPVVQPVHSVAAIDAWYLPAAHASQKALPVSTCFLPTPQSLQAVCPELSTYLPASQAVHCLTFDRNEYLPAAHGVHELAPLLVPVFVTEPGLHCLHRLSAFEPSASTYLPALQSLQTATLDCVEYLPAAHAVHVVAPVSGPVFVTEPAAHTLHDESLESAEL